ncbi:Galactose-1-phosphate uridylyltransferase [Venustampulla echinocandica]|uniref:Galactose-1-phosphate uridylyltransferase n=1 Tax=Venustampulla echinocandica TaxID=2656787 RepID=A0A370TTR3_9HELO|nr:Galactose-1-phosphate uridylyltransferase [Venustampulla echinocandica]RDL38903.1 Galactose-1-phosphate uridylyltransferase [Venustampulla echinocandica]
MPENMNILDDISHRRYNSLRGTWLLVSPHRTKRPWQGQQESAEKITLPEYDPACYLCPGNKRAQGDINPKYTETFVFVNDYSAVKEEQAEYKQEVNPEDLSNLLLRAESVKGRCYVLTFSPSHNLTLADLTPKQILPIIQAWSQVYTAHLSPASPLASVAQPPSLALANIPVSAPSAQYRWMQIFENKGAAMGCSNPHPHCQIWTTTGLPEEALQELEQLKKYRHEHGGKSLLADYAQLEIEKGERVVFQNATFLVVCPWWAVWPFEVMVISKEHKRSLVDLNDQEKLDFAEAIAEVTRRYDNLFQTSFPYSSGIHQAPLEGSDEEIEASHFHMHFYPPLLRSATVRKFLVGYELMAEPQRDITPEQAAAQLRDCGGTLYRKLL